MMTNSEREKFLLITDFDSYGGTKTYFHFLTNFLSKKDIDLKVLLRTPDVLSEGEKEILIHKRIEIGFLPRVLFIKNRFLVRLRIVSFMRILYFLLISFKSNRKVIISTGNPFLFLNAAWIFGIKFFYILHTYPTGSTSSYSKSLSFIQFIYKYILISRKIHMITVSKASKKEILRHLNIPEKSLNIEVVYNPSNFSPTLSIKNSTDIIITIGHVEIWKNPFFWLEVACYVAEKHKKAIFFWAGSGSMLKELESKIPNNLSSRIILLGHIENIEALLSKGGVYFQPSLIESHGISVVDAMAHALPCVVSRIGGLPESVDDGETGYIVDLSVEKAGDKILYLLLHKEESMKMGLAGKRKFEREFSLPQWENKMTDILINQ